MYFGDRKEKLMKLVQEKEDLMKVRREEALVNRPTLIRDRAQKERKET